MKLIKYIFFFIISLIFISCGTEKKPEQVTYSDQIAPIIYKNCTSCHRPGEAGPFNLLTYRDAVSRGKLIKFVTQSRFMPPWPADASYTHFIDEKVLTKEEIDLIASWADQGFPVGDSTKIPKPPVFPEGSQLGKPDLVIKLRDVYKIKGNGQDLF
ncbi:MAG: c-type cytochrome, partial [Bacteroidia bacterium]